MKKQSIKIAVTSLALLVTLNSCNSYKEIGAINMISRRNIDLVNKYKLIKSYAGASEKDIKHSRYESLNEAIDAIMQATPGGDFLMNAKIFKVKKSFYAVSGDVWGINNVKEDGKSTTDFKGFRVGDKVQYMKNLQKTNGTITELTNDEDCTVKDKSGKVYKVSYKKLLKAE